MGRSARGRASSGRAPACAAPGCTGTRAAAGVPRQSGAEVQCSARRGGRTPGGTRARPARVPRQSPSEVPRVSRCPAGTASRAAVRQSDPALGHHTSRGSNRRTRDYRARPGEAILFGERHSCGSQAAGDGSSSFADCGRRDRTCRASGHAAARAARRAGTATGAGPAGSAAGVRRAAWIGLAGAAAGND